jgi:hypothetical protein
METRISEAKKKIMHVLTEDKDTSTRKHEILFEVSPQVALRIKNATGIDVSGFKHSIDKSEMNHAKNRHSDAKVEQSRGQVPITNADFLMLPEILENPDSIRSIGKDKIGRETIVFEKLVEQNNIITYEAVLTGKKELAFQTLFKKSASELMHKCPAPTSETTSRNSCDAKVEKHYESAKYFTKRFAEIKKKNTASLPKPLNNNDLSTGKSM